jgi:hypothetical protein
LLRLRRLLTKPSFWLLTIYSYSSLAPEQHEASLKMSPKSDITIEQFLFQHKQ